MMLPFFWIILLGLQWVDTSVSNTTVWDNSTSVGDNSTSVWDNSTRGLGIAIQPRQGLTMRCHTCSATNTFHCPNVFNCLEGFRRCGTIALRMNSRELLVYKHCMQNCTFVLIQPPPTVLTRRLPSTNSFYYSYCCSGILCNDIGPTNIERDLLPPTVIEESVIARAVCLDKSNLLLSLFLILSSGILT
ncbi:glycosyl-phosphatidylinositol-anchored molecule-like protein [Mesocricetus auratus]|uniref:Glycosyl-phosphatidylinositol-anchored molecule-like protein n=1 Tax=Mesocricetus auratus TaxID=10036 RepID=A0ABM2WNR5_MESAU|nr:glycosyl-phosphatidylinositol-anchored molecule-like protein [Mesocricetus auratus]XP_040592430.1 glycosyl-phosphatidylinositol-anchored molecule-like protein [Mesocricetus auratus]